MALDNMKIVQNNPVDDENKQIYISGAGTIVYCKEEIIMNQAQK